MGRNRGGDKKNVTFNMEVQILGGGIVFNHYLCRIQCY